MRLSSASSVVESGGLFCTSTTEVTPPNSAPADPLSHPSFRASPGSRKCTCTSTSPGITVLPRPSISGKPPSSPAPTASITPSTIRTSTATSPGPGG
jgi:hypothetical protein